MWQESYDGKPSVYLVPTPIGNLGDMTFRAIEVLKSVDVIFSEDTRVTLQLLNYFNIKNKLIHLDDHNEELVKEQVLNYLLEEKNVAIVTDRGTPIISDPGYKTVKFLKDKGYKFKWYAIGEGHDREKIENRIKHNNLEKEFILLGSKDNPYPYMKKCNL